MSRRTRECGPIKNAGLGRSDHPRPMGWIRANIADGTWTLNDPDGTASGITNIDGLNQIVCNTVKNDKVVDGAVLWKEVLDAKGRSLDFSDSPCVIEFYVHMPSQGWQVHDGSGNVHASGGLNRPGSGSRCYVVAGVMTDPENLPSSAGETMWPTDILGLGMQSRQSMVKHKMMAIKNVSTSAPRGALTILSQDLFAPSTTQYDNDGRKFCNRIAWRTRIAKHDQANTTGINVAGEPLANEFAWDYYYDNGDRKTGTLEVIVDQRFGRVRTDKLYVWIAFGRSQGGAGNPVTIDAEIYYRIFTLRQGNNPSGRTGL